MCPYMIFFLAIIVALVMWRIYQYSTTGGFEGVGKAITLEELASYNGVDKKEIYVSVKNIVFDVTNSDHYNKTGEGYNIFAGKDISIALAKMSFDPKYFNNYGKIKITDKEEEVLNDWYTRTYDAKYTKIGYISEKAKSE